MALPRVSPMTLMHLMVVLMFSPLGVLYARGNSHGSLSLSRRHRGWCAVVVSRAVSCAVSDGVERHVKADVQPCGWGRSSCPHIMVYRTYMRPKYKTAYKTVTRTQWRCCPGFGGPGCNNGPSQKTNRTSTEKEPGGTDISRGGSGGASRVVHRRPAGFNAKQAPSTQQFPYSHPWQTLPTSRHHHQRVHTEGRAHSRMRGEKLEELENEVKQLTKAFSTMQTTVSGLQEAFEDDSNQLRVLLNNNGYGTTYQPRPPSVANLHIRRPEAGIGTVSGFPVPWPDDLLQMINKFNETLQKKNEVLERLQNLISGHDHQIHSIMKFVQTGEIKNQNTSPDAVEVYFEGGPRSSITDAKGKSPATAHPSVRETSRQTDKERRLPDKMRGQTKGERPKLRDLGILPIDSTEEKQTDKTDILNLENGQRNPGTSFGDHSSGHSSDTIGGPVRLDRWPEGHETEIGVHGSKDYETGHGSIRKGQGQPGRSESRYNYLETPSPRIQLGNRGTLSGPITVGPWTGHKKDMSHMEGEISEKDRTEIGHGGSSVWAGDPGSRYGGVEPSRPDGVPITSRDKNLKTETDASETKRRVINTESGEPRIQIGGSTPWFYGPEIAPGEPTTQSRDHDEQSKDPNTLRPEVLRPMELESQTEVPKIWQDNSKRGTMEAGWWTRGPETGSGKPGQNIGGERSQGREHGTNFRSPEIRQWGIKSGDPSDKSGHSELDTGDQRNSIDGSIAKDYETELESNKTMYQWGHPKDHGAETIHGGPSEEEHMNRHGGSSPGGVPGSQPGDHRATTNIFGIIDQDDSEQRVPFSAPVGSTEIRFVDQDTLNRKLLELKKEILEEIRSGMLSKDRTCSCSSDVSNLQKVVANSQTSLQLLEEKVHNLFTGQEQLSDMHKKLSSMPRQRTTPQLRPDRSCCHTVSNLENQLRSMGRNLSSLSDAYRVLNGRLDNELAALDVTPEMIRAHSTDRILSQLHELEARLNVTERTAEEHCVYTQAMAREVIETELTNTQDRFQIDLQNLRAQMIALKDQLNTLKRTSQLNGPSLVDFGNHIRDRTDNQLKDAEQKLHNLLKDTLRNSSLHRDLEESRHHENKKIVQHLVSNVSALNEEMNNCKERFDRLGKLIEPDICQGPCRDKLRNIEKMAENCTYRYSSLLNNVEENKRLLSELNGAVNHSGMRTYEVSGESAAEDDENAGERSNCEETSMCKSLQNRLQRLTVHVQILNGSVERLSSNFQNYLGELSIPEKDGNDEMSAKIFWVHQKQVPPIRGHGRIFQTLEGEMTKKLDNTVKNYDRDLKADSDELEKRMTDLERTCEKIASMADSIAQVKDGLTKHVGALWSHVNEMNDTLLNQKQQLGKITVACDSHLDLWLEMQKQIKHLNESIALIRLEVQEFAGFDELSSGMPSYITGPPGPAGTPGPQGRPGPPGLMKAPDSNHLRGARDVVEPLSFAAAVNVQQRENTIIKFGYVINNDGGHYNPNTGIFTAPIGGRYFVSAVLVPEKNGQIFAILSRSNTSMLYVDSSGPDTEEIEKAPQAMAVDQRPCCGAAVISLVLPLAVGDTLFLELVEGRVHGARDTYSTFSAALLYEDTALERH
uniref:EMILIN-2-like n=1 Tax=Myxine glutinosa TaxID=7769 RepID=UPI00358F0EFC